MPLKRIYDKTRKLVCSSVYDGYRDRLGRWSDIQEYMPFLYEQASKRKGPVILELGARKGNSTLAFLAATNGKGQVWSSDIDNILKYRDGIGPWRRASNWTFVCGDDMSPQTQQMLPAAMDILFIDTSHEYEHTLAECRAYVPRVRSGGIALFHDTHLKSWPGYNWQGGKSPVWTALDDYCAESGLTWTNLDGIYGMGIIEIA